MDTENPLPPSAHITDTDSQGNNQGEDLPLVDVEQEILKFPGLRQSLEAGWSGKGRFWILQDVANKFEQFFIGTPNAQQLLDAFKTHPVTCPKAYMWGYRLCGKASHRGVPKEHITPRHKTMYDLLKHWVDTPFCFVPFLNEISYSSYDSIDTEKKGPTEFVSRFRAMVGESSTQTTSKTGIQGGEDIESLKRLIAGILARSLFYDKFNEKMGRLISINSVIEGTEPAVWLKNWVSGHPNKTRPGLLFHLGWLDGAQNAIEKEASEFTNTPDKLILMLEWIANCNKELFGLLQRYKSRTLWNVLKEIKRNVSVNNPVETEPPEPHQVTPTEDVILPDERKIEEAFLHFGGFINEYQDVGHFSEKILSMFAEERALATDEENKVKTATKEKKAQAKEQAQRKRLERLRQREKARVESLPVGAVLLELEDTDGHAQVKRICLVKGHSSQKDPETKTSQHLALIVYYSPMSFERTGVSVAKHYLADVLDKETEGQYVRLLLSPEEMNSLLPDKKPPQGLPDWLQNKVLEWDNKIAPFTPISHTRLPPTPQHNTL